MYFTGHRYLEATCFAGAVTSELLEIGQSMTEKVFFHKDIGDVIPSPPSLCGDSKLLLIHEQRAGYKVLSLNQDLPPMSFKESSDRADVKGVSVHNSFHVMHIHVLQSQFASVSHTKVRINVHESPVLPGVEVFYLLTY